MIQNLATLVVSKHNVTPAHVSNAEFTHGACGLVRMPSSFINGGVQSQMPNLMSNATMPNLAMGSNVPSVVGNSCARMQTCLSGILNLSTMGQWNPLQFQQVMQALQTLASIGVCQACQLVGLNGQQLAQKGQGLMGSMPHVVGIMETHINA